MSSKRKNSIFSRRRDFHTEVSADSELSTKPLKSNSPQSRVRSHTQNMQATQQPRLPLQVNPDVLSKANRRPLKPHRPLLNPLSRTGQASLSEREPSFQLHSPNKRGQGLPNLAERSNKGRLESQSYNEIFMSEDHRRVNSNIPRILYKLRK